MTDSKKEPASPATETEKDKTVPQTKPAGDKPNPLQEIVDKQVSRPRGVIGRIRAEDTARPPALPVPAASGDNGHNVQAYTSQAAIDRWQEESSGIRMLEIGDNVITMFDAIGESYWSEGVTAKSVAKSLRAIGPRDVEVHLNSPGGDMFEGIAIYNVLREHPHQVTVKIMGIAASAASIIAMAGDKIEIGAGSFLMVHNCWIFAQGNQHDFREIADWLGPFDAAMAEVYAYRSKGKTTAEAMAALMTKESYLSGSTAIKLGLADDLLPSDKTTVDSDAKAKDKETNRLRSMEISLMQARGLSRSQARAEIKALMGGTTDSAPKKDGTKDSAVDDTPPEPADPALMSAMAGLLATLKGEKS